MKKILLILFSSIFLLVSCDTLQTNNTVTVGTNNSYWRYDYYYRNYYRYNRQFYWNYPRQKVIIKQRPQQKIIILEGILKNMNIKELKEFFKFVEKRDKELINNLYKYVGYKI